MPGHIWARLYVRRKCDACCDVTEMRSSRRCVRRQLLPWVSVFSCFFFLWKTASRWYFHYVSLTLRHGWWCQSAISNRTDLTAKFRFLYFFLFFFVFVPLLFLSLSREREREGRGGERETDPSQNFRLPPTPGAPVSDYSDVSTNITNCDCVRLCSVRHMLYVSPYRRANKGGRATLPQSSNGMGGGGQICPIHWLSWTCTVIVSRAGLWPCKFLRERYEEARQEG